VHNFQNIFASVSLTGTLESLDTVTQKAALQLHPPGWFPQSPGSHRMPWTWGFSLVSPQRAEAHAWLSLFEIPAPTTDVPTSGLPRLHKLYIVSINPIAPFFLSRCKGVGNHFSGRVWSSHQVGVGPRTGSNRAIPRL
jgi:hypothetical protein